MKLAIVSLLDILPWGGSEELWAAAALAACDRGMEVEAFLYAWPELPVRVMRLQDRGVRVHRRPLRPRFSQRLAGRLLDKPVWLAQQLQRAQPDLILFSQGSTYDLAREEAVLNFLEESQLPYVVVCQHNFETPIGEETRQAGRRVFRHASLIAFVSHRNLQASRRQLAVDLPQAIVLQNPINLNKYESIPWPLSPTASLACVARYSVGPKGQDLLFEALGGLEWRQRDWKLSLFGEGKDRAYLFDLAKLYGIIDKVQFRGHCSDVGQIWSEQQLLVLPSRSEGTPLALIEALIAGRPALVTDVGDSARWLREGETGFIAEGTTAASISCALERAWAARRSWREMGQRSHLQTVSVIDRNPGATLLMHALEAANLSCETANSPAINSLKV
jgi:glycosyltransferase involved in cell wall biosynthesis